VDYFIQKPGIDGKLGKNELKSMIERALL